MSNPPSFKRLPSLRHNTHNVKASFDLRNQVALNFLIYTCKQACCGSKLVPPPTVPISIEGIVQLMYRSSLVEPVRSIKVMQLELPTFCAASFRSGRREKTQNQSTQLSVWLRTTDLNKT